MLENSPILSFEQRAQIARLSVAKELFLLMSDKKTNLALSADVASCEELLEITERVGSEIAVLKTHVDILEDFNPSFLNKLTSLALAHRFFIFEDRKFADIGNTVSKQYQGGVYKIASWSHFTNAHILPGPGIIHGLKKIGLPLKRGLLLLAEMSSEGNLINEAYRTAALNMASAHRDFVAGFICQKRITNDPEFIHFTPGISIEKSGDALGQQYKSPHDAIAIGGSDVAIVGRSILESKNPLEAAQRYREECWKSYLSRSQASVKRTKDNKDQRP